MLCTASARPDVDCGRSALDDVAQVHLIRNKEARQPDAVWLLSSVFRPILLCLFTHHIRGDWFSRHRWYVAL
jgi:hypothetical protein